MKKNTLKLLMVSAAACMAMLFTLALGGCSEDGSKAMIAMISEGDLKHHNYVLESVDGRPFSTEFETPSLAFGEDFSVSGRVCNNFRGQAELKNNILKVENMASTMMMCPEQQLNDLERDFGQMLRSGAEITLSEGKLTLRQGERALVYKLRDYVN